MALLPMLLQGIPEAPPLNPIARWEGIFPVIEAMHICGFTLLVRTVAILDLRRLGVWLRRRPVCQTASELSLRILSGTVIRLTTGPYLLSSDPGEYVQVPAFRNKTIFLALALIFHFTVIRKATAPTGGEEPLGCVALQAPFHWRFGFAFC